jgi:hypothetical protein
MRDANQYDEEGWKMFKLYQFRRMLKMEVQLWEKSQILKKIKKISVFPASRCFIRHHDVIVVWRADDIFRYFLDIFWYVNFADIFRYIP